MLKRFVLILITIILVISIGVASIYYINPYNLKTDNIRPRVFGFDIYQIPSKSMQPLLFPGDYITVSNIAYLKVLPKKQDVVVFYQPNKNSGKEKIPFIKRVIATAGDTIQLQNGKLFINKHLIEEDYVNMANNKTPYSLVMKKFTVPQSHVFVMGDNRDNSSDSRIFGTIANDAIIAQAGSILYGKNKRNGKQIK